MLNSPIIGEEKREYLIQLDRKLEVLQDYFKFTPEQQRAQRLRDFGESHNWNWTRLPLLQNTGKEVAKYIQKVQEMYQLFQRMDNLENHLDNRSFFDEITISLESGLPWFFNFVRLQELKEEAPQRLTQLPRQEELAKQLVQLLTTDYKEISEVPNAVISLRETSLQINYLEHLLKTDLLSWKADQYSIPVQAKRLLRAGAEEFWNISFLRYQNSSSFYEIYILDTWQDDNEKVLTEDESGKVQISSDIPNLFRFNRDNTCGYILSKFDEIFPSLHPVHISRILIGPYENIYRTNKKIILGLDVIAEIIKKDPQASFLRTSWVYAFAPNSEEREGQLRQLVPHSDWREEIIICPQEHSATISKELLGTDLKILGVK